MALCDPGEEEGEREGARHVEMYLHRKFYDCTPALMVIEFTHSVYGKFCCFRGQDKTTNLKCHVVPFSFSSNHKNKVHKNVTLTKAIRHAL